MCVWLAYVTLLVNADGTLFFRTLALVVSHNFPKGSFRSVFSIPSVLYVYRQWDARLMSSRFSVSSYHRVPKW